MGLLPLATLPARATIAGLEVAVAGAPLVARDGPQGQLAQLVRLSDSAQSRAGSEHTLHRLGEGVASLRDSDQTLSDVAQPLTRRAERLPGRGRRGAAP